VDRTEREKNRGDMDRIVCKAMIAVTIPPFPKREKTGKMEMREEGRSQ
jgi:hypothetical protein